MFLFSETKEKEKVVKGLLSSLEKSEEAKSFNQSISMENKKIDLFFLLLNQKLARKTFQSFFFQIIFIHYRFLFLFFCAKKERMKLINHNQDDLNDFCFRLLFFFIVRNYFNTR